MATFKHTEKAFTVPEHHWVDVNSLGCLPTFSCWKQAEAPTPPPHTHTPAQVSPSRDQLTTASSLPLLRSQRAGVGGNLSPPPRLSLSPLSLAPSPPHSHLRPASDSAANPTTVQHFPQNHSCLHLQMPSTLSNHIPQRPYLVPEVLTIKCLVQENRSIVLRIVS